MALENKGFVDHKPTYILIFCPAIKFKIQLTHIIHTFLFIQFVYDTAHRLIIRTQHGHRHNWVVEHKPPGLN